MSYTTYTVSVTDIKYDFTDVKKVKLPNVFVFDIVVENGVDRDIVLQDEIANLISNKTGYLVNNFKYDIMFPPSEITEEDLKKATERAKKTWINCGKAVGECIILIFVMNGAHACVLLADYFGAIGLFVVGVIHMRKLFKISS